MSGARPRIRYAVLTLSDRGSAGLREDLSGPLLAAAAARALGEEAWHRGLLADDRNALAFELIRLADRERCDLILTTGGTGLSPRDLTPEATRDVIDREIPGLAELLRSEGRDRNPRVCLSRALCGIRGRTLIVNLPGSPRAVAEQFARLGPLLPHALESLSGAVLDCAS